MSDLPSIDSVIHTSPSGPDSPLSLALSTLFEPSSILQNRLIPQLCHVLSSFSPPVSTYTQLIGIAIEQISTWDKESQSQFISGHPRIGETKNLSKLSAKEQNAALSVTPTPPEVLARLAHLNACYEKRYPGLVYIIFVNGRSRAAIAEIMEDQLELEHSLSPDIPVVDSIKAVQVGGEEWTSELNRAVRDVGLIARSRLKALGVE
jgi:2-oxo-4-hydroxy-4-carboxy--5-ureidoimidazoline (OHCU) decarboxylase